MKVMTGLLTGVCLAALAGHACAAIVGGSNYVAQTYYANPHAAETLVAFDWDDNGDLYYSTGRPDWALGFSVYRYDGASAENLYTDESAFSGSRVTAIGNRIYFNDGGTYSRYTCDYYRYDPASQAAPVNLGMQSDIYGLETREGSDFWAAGGYTAAIYYSPLNSNGGLENNPLVNLGTIGEASGPIAFDANGNLYYTEGYVYSGNPTVYRWSAAEVAAAIANPTNNPLNPEGHAWTTLSSGDGATGMVVDDNGNVVVTATSFTSPSQLQRLLVSDGVCVGYEVLADSDERLETVRLHNGTIYVSSSDGIFAVVRGQSDKVPVSGDFDGDRKNDLALYQASAGTWFVKLSASGYAEARVALGGTNNQAIPKDFDGDGKTDPAVYDEITGNWAIMMSGSGYAVATLTAFGGSGYIPVAQDFDGDGKADPAVYHEASGGWEVKMSGSGYKSVFLSNFGGTGYQPAAMDYDGDGKADPAIYQQSTGNWTIKLSGSDYTQISLSGFGGTGYQVVSGMYDQDSHADEAVYKTDTGDWTVLLSSGNHISITMSGFGGADYAPAVGDYDGDGKADPAVYNKTLSKWLIKLSGNNYTTISVTQ